MKAVLLCAGYATRLGELTIETPKALLPLANGKTNIDYLCDDLDTIKELDEAILVTNDRYFNKFQEWDKTRKSWHFKITIVNDKTTCNEDRLGAIGDTIFALKAGKIDDDTMICVTDNLFSFSLKEVYNYFKLKNADVVITQIKDKSELANRFGVAELDKDNRVLEIIEKPAQPKTNYGVYAIYFLKKESVKLYNEYKRKGLPLDAPGNFVAYLCKIKPVYAFSFKGEGFDIGSIESYHAAQEYKKNK